MPRATAVGRAVRGRGELLSCRVAGREALALTTGAQRFRVRAVAYVEPRIDRPDQPRRSRALLVGTRAAASTASRFPDPSGHAAPAQHVGMRFEVVGPIRDERTIATGRRIRHLRALIRRYGPGRWRKKSGRGMVRLPDGTTRPAELHWYEATGIGRRSMKIKRYLDE